MNEPTIQVNQKWTKNDREGKLRLLMEGRTNSRYKLKQNMRLLWYVVLRKKKLKVKSAELRRAAQSCTEYIFRTLSITLIYFAAEYKWVVCCVEESLK